MADFRTIPGDRRARHVGCRRLELGCLCPSQGQNRDSRPRMILKPTVFVLGAGASCPYGLPDGPTLARDIVELIRNRGDAFNLLKRFVSRVDDLSSFAQALAQQGPGATVDDLLRRSPQRPEWRDVARVAIPAALIPRESSALLDAVNPDHHWAGLPVRAHARRGSRRLRQESAKRNHIQLRPRVRDLLGARAAVRLSRSVTNGIESFGG
jgi:hypothetical protein